MHPNAAFRPAPADVTTEAAAARLIGEVGFGMVFLTTPDGPRVAHTPLLLRPNGRLAFHLARGNVLTRHLDGATALALVNGADGYVSPRWYTVADQVPTWNYIAVECEGPVRRLDHDELIELLTDLSTHNEARIEGVPWTMDKVSDKAMAGLTGAIVGFEMTVAEQRATFKLSQNKPADQHERVIAGLQASGQHAIAAMMRA